MPTKSSPGDAQSEESSPGSPRVLIVEDDPFVSLHLETILTRAGMEAAGVANTVDEALKVIEETDPDVAVLDVNIRGTYVFPVAEKLQAAGTPFVFVSAYANDKTLFPAHLRDAPREPKPVDPNRLIAVLTALTE